MKLILKGYQEKETEGIFESWPIRHSHLRQVVREDYDYTPNASHSSILHLDQKNACLRCNEQPYANYT